MANSAQSLLNGIGVFDFNLTDSLVIGGLIYIRILMVITLLPYLGGKTVPAMIKGAVSLAITLFVYFLIIPNIDSGSLPKQSFLIGILFMKEALFGFLIGFVNMMVFQGIQAAGSMIDNQRYVANARVFNPALGAQTSIFGSYLFQLSIALFIVMGGHRYMLNGIIQSFQTVPLFSFPNMGTGITPIIDLMIRLAGDTLIICLQLSAPVLIAIFVADLILGVTNRIAPMINVFEMGFNIKGFVGVLLVYLSIPLIVYQTKHWFQSMMGAFNKLTIYFH